MKTICLHVLFLLCISLAGHGQCSDPLFQGYAGKNIVSVSEAYRILISDLSATTNCNISFPIRSLHLQVVQKNEVILDLRINGRMTAEEKKKVFKYVKPATTILLGSIKVGQEGRFVPDVILIIK